MSLGRSAKMFWATYLEATCPSSSPLCSALPSDSSGWHERSNSELWEALSESLSLGCFGGFRGWIPSPPGLEIKEDKRSGDPRSMYCHGWQPNLEGPQLQCEQVCSKGRKPLLWHLPGDREMRWNLDCSWILSWPNLAPTTWNNLAQPTVYLGKWWEVYYTNYVDKWICNQ